MQKSNTTESRGYSKQLKPLDASNIRKLLGNVKRDQYIIIEFIDGRKAKAIFCEAMYTQMIVRLSGSVRKVRYDIIASIIPTADFWIDPSVIKRDNDKRSEIDLLVEESFDR